MGSGLRESSVRTSNPLLQETVSVTQAAIRAGSKYCHILVKGLCVQSLQALPVRI